MTEENISQVFRLKKIIDETKNISLKKLSKMKWFVINTKMFVRF